MHSTLAGVHLWLLEQMCPHVQLEAGAVGIPSGTPCTVYELLLVAVGMPPSWVVEGGMTGDPLSLHSSGRRHKPGLGYISLSKKFTE